MAEENNKKNPTVEINTAELHVFNKEAVKVKPYDINLMTNTSPTPQNTNNNGDD